MRKLFILLCGVLCLGIFQKAQDLQHEVNVTLKLIQVYVTDEKNQPVTDLKIEDFRIYDKNKLQKITEFEKHILNPEIEIPAVPYFEPDVVSNGPPPAAMNRKFFLFFDLVNNNPKGFRKAQEAALHFIDNQVQPSDEVGVLSFSVLKQLSLHEYLTKDLPKIRAAVENIGESGMVGRAENFEAIVWREISTQSALDAGQATQPILTAPAHLKGQGDPLLAPARQKELQFEREGHKLQIRKLMSQFIDLSKALRYISGQKHLLYFSSGIPNSLIHGVTTRTPGEINEFRADPVLRLQYQEMLKELSSANISVFSLNTEPLSKDMNVPANQKGEATLRRISQYTGGQFLGNIQNYVDAFETVQTLTGSYYVLGYSCDENWDGRYHSIKVEADRPGCKVFAQKGYFNPKPFSKYNRIEKELHLFDLALSERPYLQIPVSIPVTGIAFPFNGNPGVLMLAKIPGKSLASSMGEQTEIYFLIFDGQDNIVDVKRKAVNISSLKNNDSYYYTLMPLSPGPYKYRVVIRDLENGKGAVGRDSGDIPEIPKKGLKIYPPLLLCSGKSGPFIRGYVPETEKSDFPLLDFFPFDPNLFFPIIETVPKNTEKIQAILHLWIRDLDKPALKFKAALLDNTSRETTQLPVTVVSGKTEGEMGTVFTELKIPKMKSGDYLLIILAGDVTGQIQSQTTRSIRIQ